MLRKPKLYNEDFLNEVGSFKDISKLKNLGVANPAPQNDFDPSGTQFPEMQATAPIEFGDVRKNESPYFKLGKYLGSEQTQEQQQPNQMMPPEPMQQQAPEMQQPGFNPANLGKYFGGVMGSDIHKEILPPSIYKPLSGIAGYLATDNQEQEMPQSAAQMPQVAESPTAMGQLENQAPNVNAPQMEMQAPQVPVSPGNDLMNQINTGIKEREAEGKPPFFAAPQAVETALANPEQKSILEKLYGKEIDPTTMQEMKDAELALTDQFTSENERAAYYKKRIDEHGLTTQDKVIMGLALLAPAILAGIVGGPEGVLQALGGGLEGMGTALQADSEQRSKDFEKLSETKEKQSEIQLKKAELKQTMLDAIPNAKLKKALQGRSIEEVVSPDGDVEAYGISTASPDLFIDANRIHSEADLKRFDEKDVPEMKLANSTALTMNKTLDGLDYILDQIKEKGMLDQKIKSDAPFLQDNIMTIDGDILNAGEALETIDQTLRDNYRIIKGIKGFGPTVTEHFEGLLIGPYGKESAWKGRNKETVSSKARQFRSLINSSHEQNLESSGFLSQPFKKKVAESEQVKQGQLVREQNKRASFLRKNPKEWEKAQKGQFVGGKK